MSLLALAVALLSPFTQPASESLRDLALARREHPFLFGDRQTFSMALDRAQRLPWARQVLDGIIAAGDAALAMEVVVPDEPGQWSMHYVCKQCGAGLRQEGARHVCAHCGAEYTGWPYDQVVAGHLHFANWERIRTLGLAYAFTGREDYARRARDLLLAYSAKYLTYPRHDKRNLNTPWGARVFAQTLDEAVGIIGVAWGYDLVYNSPCFSAEDREQIETRFLRPVTDTIRGNPFEINNWQSWHNAALAAVGFCLQDSDLVSLALDGMAGMRFQLEHQVLSDGFWFEGTPAYHYYALDALRWTAESAFHAGLDICQHPRYKALYDAPLLYTFPDLTFPAVNDSDPFSITGQHRLYEIGYARFGDGRYLPILEAGGRSSLEALLWGVEKLPPPVPHSAPPVESARFDGVGAVVLRQGSGPDQFYAHLDYGPHGGFHGHFDKLALIFYALGRELAPDPGRLPYAAPQHNSWYKQTIAHNTVCVDMRSQAPAQGRLDFFGSTAGLAAATAECEEAYPGVQLRRTVVLTDSYLLDVFTTDSAQTHIYDWVLHSFGDTDGSLSMTPLAQPLGHDHGYQHFSDVREGSGDKTWWLDFRQPSANLCLTMLGAPDTRVFLGTGLYGNPPRSEPMVVARRHCRATSFVSILEPYRTSPTVTAVRLLPAHEHLHAMVVELQRGHVRDLILISERPGIERDLAGKRTTARVCLVRWSPETGSPEFWELN